MVTLDRIKILTDKKNVSHMDSDVSSIVLKSNIQQEIRYKQQKPYQLYINNYQRENKSVIEVSAKVLGDGYPELINNNNIGNCFERINSLGVCRLDVDGIINDSKLISCDITRDVEGIKMPEKLALNSCLKSFNKFHVQKYANSGFTVTKQVKTRSRQIRLSFYNKHKELLKTGNSEFLNMVNDKNELLEYFDNRFRIESNVRTVSQIRDLFQTDDNSLKNVLNSDSNPLLQIFDTIFDVPESVDSFNEIQHILSYGSFAELKNALILKECNYDPDTIDLVLNHYLSPKTNKRKYRTKFNHVINSCPNQNENIELLRKVREGLR